MDLFKIREPTEEESDFFYKRNTNKYYNNKLSSKNYENFQKANKDSYAIVLKDESSLSDSILNANRRNKINEEITRVKAPKFKEKSLVIKVKKNMAEDELEKKENEGNVISPVVDDENNNNNESNKESKKGNDIKSDIGNYADFEDEINIEPLI